MKRGSSTPGLRRIRTGELRLGQPVPGHDRDRAGRILIRKGRRLTEKHLQLIREREQWEVFADSDWPGAGLPLLVVPTAEELAQALKRRRGSREDAGRTRRHARHRWTVRLRVTMVAAGKGGIQRHELEVVTCDVSAKGFSFVCNRFVYPGTTVYPCFHTLPGAPVMKGLVRNCTHLEGRQHRVGVEFVPLEPNEVPPGA